MPLPAVCVCLAVVWLCAACGQKGPLTLPKSATAASAPASAR